MKPRDVHLLVLFLTSFQWCLQSALRAVFLWTRRYHLHHIYHLRELGRQPWTRMKAQNGFSGTGEVAASIRACWHVPGRWRQMDCNSELQSKTILKLPGGKKGNMPFQPNSHLDDFWQYISICPQNLPRGFCCGWLTPLKTQPAVSLSRRYQ